MAKKTPKRAKKTPAKKSAENPTRKRGKKKTAAKKRERQTKRPAKKKAPTKQRKVRGKALAAGESTAAATESGGGRSTSAAYEAHRERQRESQAAASRAGRDIGPIPKPANPKRRASCERDFKRFCETYFQNTFCFPWSKTHLKLIDLIEVVVLNIALLAMGIPRGWGKTTLSVSAVIWAIAYGHHKFVVLIAATNPAAEDLLSDVLSEFESNALLREDFPELCIPFAALNGQSNKAKGQLSCGTRTRINMTGKHQLDCASIDAANHASYGARIVAGGILSSRIRGLRKRIDGEIWRPTLGLVDDPQTEMSANSKPSTEKRERVIKAALKGLPGVGRSWSCLMTMTVIAPDDLADRILDRDKHPTWRGIRARHLATLPNDSAMELWAEYFDIYKQCCLRDENDTWEATEFYRSKMKAMNAGAKENWKYGFDKKKCQISATQNAMDWYFEDKTGFWSELQNDPAGAIEDNTVQIDRDAVVTRWHHCPRLRIPNAADLLTLAGDVQGNSIWWELRAHAMDGTSWSIDYNTWPGQTRQYFTLSDLKLTLQSVYPKLSTDLERWTAAIGDLFGEKMGREYTREDGTKMRINMAGLDANYNAETVKKAIRAAGMRGRVIPTHGRSFAPPKTPIDNLPKKDGERVGDGWRIRPPARGSRDMKHLLFDNNVWKSNVRDALTMPAAATGALLLYKGRDHRMLADNYAAEKSTLITDNSTGKTSEVWTEKPDRPDNHFFDVAVINQILGNVLGVRLPGHRPPVSGRKKKKKRKTRVKT